MAVVAGKRANVWGGVIKQSAINRLTMFYFSLPQAPAVSAFIQKEKQLPFTYQEHGATASPDPVRGFDNDSHRVKIGHGDTDFLTAKRAIQSWKMFPKGWTVILPEDAPVREGETIAMFARAFGGWWRNSCRIVYIIDEPRRYGFAYGTLPGHIEKGEELFLVEQDTNGDVWYAITAFSQPHHWLAKIAYPVMRMFQARFRRDSGNSMIIRK